jgi:hypothetical protein
MFETREWYQELAEKLEEADKGKELTSIDAISLLKVELGLYLLEILGCTSEPIHSVWIWLTKLPIIDTKRQNLDSKQRQALANACVLLHFGRFEWIALLKAYGALAACWRCYRVNPAQLDLPVMREPNGPTRVTGRFAVYDRWLFREIMPYHLRRDVSASAGKVFFRVTYPRTRVISAELDEIALQTAQGMARTYFSDALRQKQVPVIEYAHLLATAQELDTYEARPEVNLRPRTEWEKLVHETIHYRLFRQDGKLGPLNADPLVLQGHVHLPGMVGAGKSLTAKLIAVRGALHGGWRTTLVVGDVLTAIQLADYFNQVLVGKSGLPVAVPLLGRTTRYLHLARFYRSETFRHESWALRWLDTRCALQGMISANELQEGPLRPGSEPCERLWADEADIGQPDKRLLCPFFTACPVHQMYHDMHAAPIWITTAGAMEKSRLPAQVDPRQILLGELIYHESDLVIFDECETIQQWFDNAYAANRNLVDSPGGALAVINHITSEYLERERTVPDGARRWIISSIRAWEVALLVRDRLRHIEFLKRWVGGRYFTAHRLFSSLALRLFGFPSYEQLPSHQAAMVEKLLEKFTAFHQDDIMPPSRTSLPAAVAELHDIADAILARGGAAVDSRATDMCMSWITNHVPDIATTLSELQRRAEAWDKRQAKRRRQAQVPVSERADTLSTLVTRLEFAVAVSVLERLVNITFRQWYNAPPAIASRIQNEDRLQPVPEDLIGVIPTAPTGSLFGFLYVDEERRADDSPPGEPPHGRASRLLAFQYDNVGRWYMLHFHDLLNQLGYPGPQVLSLSGTSWLPDAASWHLQVLAAGVMMANPQSTQAIKASSFRFLPQRDEKGNAITVSGSPNLEKNVWRLARELAGTPSPAHCPLRRELNHLKALEEQEVQRNQKRPEAQCVWHWKDRQRILLLVNSYDQVRWVVAAILSKQPDWESKVYGLVRPLEEGEEQDDQWLPANALLGQRLVRPDIESFPRLTSGQILVAPLQAIGRGYNILNEERVAAFGSIFFLTRPMPLPFDMVRRSQWMNRQVLNWCADEKCGLWQAATYAEKGERLRKKAHDEWDEYEGWREGSNGARPMWLINEARWKDLAASLAGVIIQACGRLLRGGVPFRATFVDAAWAPHRAAGSRNRSREPDTPKNSLLLAMIDILDKYCRRDPVARALYGPLVKALKRDFRDMLQ